MIECLGVGFLSVRRHARHIHLEGKLRDVLVVEFLWHHPVCLNVVIDQVEHLACVTEDTSVVRAIADEKEHEGRFSLHCLMLFSEDDLASHSGEFEGHAIDDVLCDDLRLEPEPSIDIVAAFLLLVEHPAVTTDHDMLAQLGKV
jgi:hypothetical protein